MSQPRPLSPVLALRAEAARRLGCEVTPLDPETGYLCELRRGARRRHLLGGISPLNDAAAARIAEDKYHTALLLGRAGFRVVPGARCLRPGRFGQEDFSSHEGVEPARRFAAEHGFPLVVKPNRGARGRSVTLVERAAELEDAVRRTWVHDYLALVQPRVPGADLRLDFLDGEYLFGYLRRPVVVRGDGTSAVGELLAAADPRFSGGQLREVLADDPIWTARVRARGLGFDSVLPADEVLDLGSAILNLNRLCLAELVGEPPPAWLEHGRRIGAALGLRHFGVDFKTEDPAGDPRAAAVLEVNASPSLAQMSRMGYYDEAIAAEIRVVEAILSLE